MKAQIASATITFGNILYATDFSKQSNTALPFALSIAHKYGSKLLAVHVVTPPPLEKLEMIEVQALEAQALREAHDSLEEIERRLGGIRHQSILRKGEIWHELSDISENENVDLIVLGTHGRAGVSKLLMGSVAEKIFRQSACPVLTIGPNVSAEPGSVADIHTILCPIDFTEASLAAFPYAVSLAKENKARLYLLNVAPGPVLEPQKLELVARLKALVPQDADLWCEPKAFVESGEAAEIILEQAEELAIDLIVLGIRPVSTLAGTKTHLGTATAYDVVRRAICPVLSVRG